MPRALPLGGTVARLPIDNDPNLDFTQKLPNVEFRIEDMIAQWGESWQKLGVPAIKQLTGLDFSTPESLVLSLGALITDGVARNALQGLKDALAGVASATDAQLNAWRSSLLDGQSPLDASMLENLENIGEIAQDKIGGLVEDLGTAVANAATAITRAQGLKDVLAGVASATDAQLNAWRNDLLNSQSPLDASLIENLENIGEIAQDRIAQLPQQLGDAVADAADAIAKAQGWLNGFFAGITGSTPTEPVTIAEAQAKAAAISEIQAAQAAGLTRLQAAFDGAATEGVSGTDTFDRVGVDLGGPAMWAETWTGTGNAHVETDGADALIVTSDTTFTSGRLGQFRCTTPGMQKTLTSFQKITVTAGAKSPAKIDATTLNGVNQGLRIRFRVNEFDTQYGFVDIGGNAQARWGYRNGGIDTYVKSAFACALPSAGVQYRVEAGTTQGARYYRLYRNSTLVDTWDDSLTALVATGPDNLGWGWALQFGYFSSLGNYYPLTPCSVTAVSVSDNMPPSVPGSSARIRRLATSSVSASAATSAAALPDNVFDDLEYKSSGLTVNLATGEVTVDKRGTYMVDYRIELASNINSNDVLPAVFKNGSVYAYGQEIYHGNITAGAGANNIHDNFLVQCEPGDVLRPGRINTGSYSIVGGYAGAVTFFAVTRITQ